METKESINKKSKWEWWWWWCWGGGGVAGDRNRTFVLIVPHGKTSYDHNITDCNIGGL